MEQSPVTRVLVVTDHTAATPELLAAMRQRAAQGPVQFRLLVPNPAQAELHLFHPERHDKAAEAEQVACSGRCRHSRRRPAAASSHPCRSGTTPMTPSRS